MALRDQIRSKRKDTRWVVGSLIFLLATLSAIYYGVQRSRDLSASLVTDRVLLFVLLYINVILILTILLVLLRNLFKMIVDRRHRLLGSNFRIKLVGTYIGLALVPTLLLFAYGTQLLRGWIDRWFEESSIEQVLVSADALAQALTTNLQETGLRDAARVLDSVEGADLQRSLSQSRLYDLSRELQLDYLAVYDDVKFAYGVVDPTSGLRDLPEIEPRFLADLLEEGTARQIRDLAGTGRLILTAVSAEEGEPRRLVIAGKLLDSETAKLSENVIVAYQGYKQLTIQKPEIEAGYFLIFLMVTLLILLVSSWVGLYLARRVTVPIQALADGTRRISSGDLDYRVEVPADDELGVLVDSFNRMTAELKRNKEELIDANQRLDDERAAQTAVLANVAAGVLSVDEEGTVVTGNDAALSMLGQRAEDVVGLPIDGIWLGTELRKVADRFKVTPGVGERAVGQIRVVLGGEWKTLDTKLSAIRDSDGAVTGKVMVLEDLTELIQAQQVAAWNDAARRVAHEIKNPLTPIKLSIERLLRKHQQDAPGLGAVLEESVETIAREVETMKSMVDEFSRFARMRRPQPSRFDLNRLVRDVATLYDGVKPGVEISAAIDEEVQGVWVDREQIKSVLINLVDNAIDATQAPGEIEIRARNENEQLVLEVADTGQGIPSESKSKLFLPYFSTKGRGTGLGLSIVHRIVADHHGTIRVEDNEPRGTVFRIELPQQ